MLFYAYGAAAEPSPLEILNFSYPFPYIRDCVPNVASSPTPLLYIRDGVPKMAWMVVTKIHLCEAL